MAPIDPSELLNAFKPFLTTLGGIKSVNEIARLSGFMKKFSNKLVTRCIYCNILLATNEDLLNCFLDQDGWSIVNSWLKETVLSENNEFLFDLLDLLNKCPVTCERLKTNDTPKVVKSLLKSKCEGIKDKAQILFNKWTALIESSTTDTSDLSNTPDPEASEVIETAEVAVSVAVTAGTSQTEPRARKKKRKKKESDDSVESSKSKKLKLKTNSEKSEQSFSSPNESNDQENTNLNLSEPQTESGPKTAKIKLGKSRSIGLMEETMAIKSKKSKDGPLPSPKSNGSASTLPPKLPPLKIKFNSNKSGKIEISKATASGSNKSSSSISSNTSLSTSSSTSTSTPASSSSTSATVIKPIPTLKDSEGFMQDIVNVSLESRVRKRKKSSESKSDQKSDGQSQPKVRPEVKISEEKAETGEDEDTVTSDEADEESNAGNKKELSAIISDAPNLDDLVIPPIKSDHRIVPLKSILSHSKRFERTKKSVKWKNANNLEEVKFFQLDENERVNVSKPAFGNYRTIDMKNERQMLLARKQSGSASSQSSEKVKVFLPWKLTLIQMPSHIKYPIVEPGSGSEERRIQAERMKANFTEFHLSKDLITEFPREPEPLENMSVPSSENPAIIPLEDANNPHVMDFSQYTPPAPNMGEPSFNRNTSQYSSQYINSPIPPPPPSMHPGPGPGPISSRMGPINRSPYPNQPVGPAGPSYPNYHGQHINYQGNIYKSTYSCSSYNQPGPVSGPNQSMPGPGPGPGPGHGGPPQRFIRSNQPPHSNPSNQYNQWSPRPRGPCRNFQRPGNCRYSGPPRPMYYHFNPSHQNSPSNDNLNNPNSL